MNCGIWPKILLIGNNGQVGWELERSIGTLGQVTALDYPEVDLGKPDTIVNIIRSVKPNLIINAAAYTAVDKAEEESSLTMAINGIAPGIIAEEAKKINAFLVHYSTDYVFDGTKDVPYTEEDEPNPLNVYGVTKLAGDIAIQAVGIPHLILRTSWVYGLRGKNFLLTIFRLAQESAEIRVVNDQIGAPTWCRMIAEATSQILSKDTQQLAEKSGLYNLTASGNTSWFEFATQAIKVGRPESSARIKPISSDEYPSIALRPKQSLLSNSKLNTTFCISLPQWERAMRLVLDIR